MSLSVNGGSAFIPQNLALHENSANAGQRGQSDLAASLLFAGGNGGAVNFAPPSSRVDGVNDASPPSVGHNRSMQPPINEIGGRGAEEIMNLLNSLLQALLRMMGIALTTESGGGSGSGSGGPSGHGTSSGSKNLAAPPGRGAGKAEVSAGTVSSANVGEVPKGMPQELWKDCVNAGNKFGVDPFVLAAQSKQESNFGKNLTGASGGDGVMQVEPGTRASYASQFQEKTGHSYNHNSQSDQVAMAAMIVSSKSGDIIEKLQKYNGGDNWRPGATDSYGRVIKAEEYAANVNEIAATLRKSVAGAAT